MKKIVSMTVSRPYHLVLEFDDGASGELDFSTRYRTGVFKAWEDPSVFAQVKIGERGRSLDWPGEIDLCADSLWLELTGENADSIYPGLKAVAEHA